MAALRNYIFGVRFICLLLTVAAFVSAQDRTDSSAPFDKPQETVLDVGHSPYYLPSRNMRSKLTCYIYPTFMVKEYDTGQKGAEWLSILRYQRDKRPDCSLSHLRGERVFYWKEWSGYFRGAKGSYAFFDAPDGANGGLAFAIYDTRTGKKVFADSARYVMNDDERVFFQDFSIDKDSNQRLVLRYLKVVFTDCDLNKDKSVCWNEVRTKHRIAATEPPVCASYEHDYQGKLPSVVAFPVAVVLDSHPQIKAVNGPVSCWTIE